jgi:hypothetical protein
MVSFCTWDQARRLLVLNLAVAPRSPATRSPTGSAPPKDRRKYCDPGEQEQEEGGDVPEGGQNHHAE